MALAFDERGYALPPPQSPSTIPATTPMGERPAPAFPAMQDAPPAIGLPPAGQAAPPDDLDAALARWDAAIEARTSGSGDFSGGETSGGADLGQQELDAALARWDKAIGLSPVQPPQRSMGRQPLAYAGQKKSTLSPEVWQQNDLDGVLGTKIGDRYYIIPEAEDHDADAAIRAAQHNGLGYYSSFGTRQEAEAYLKGGRRTPVDASAGSVSNLIAGQRAVVEEWLPNLSRGLGRQTYAGLPEGALFLAPDKTVRRRTLAAATWEEAPAIDAATLPKEEGEMLRAMGVGPDAIAGKWLRRELLSAVQDKTRFAGGQDGFVASRLSRQDFERLTGTKWSDKTDRAFRRGLEIYNDAKRFVGGMGTGRDGKNAYDQWASVRELAVSYADRPAADKSMLLAAVHDIAKLEKPKTSQGELDQYLGTLEHALWEVPAAVVNFDARLRQTMAREAGMNDAAAQIGRDNPQIAPNAVTMTGNISAALRKADPVAPEDGTWASFWKNASHEAVAQLPAMAVAQQAAKGLSLPGKVAAVTAVYTPIESEQWYAKAISEGIDQDRAARMAPLAGLTVAALESILPDPWRTPERKAVVQSLRKAAADAALDLGKRYGTETIIEEGSQGFAAAFILDVARRIEGKEAKGLFDNIREGWEQGVAAMGPMAFTMGGPGIAQIGLATAGQHALNKALSGTEYGAAMAEVAATETPTNEQLVAAGLRPSDDPAIRKATADGVRVAMGASNAVSQPKATPDDAGRDPQPPTGEEVGDTTQSSEGVPVAGQGDGEVSAEEAVRRQQGGYAPPATRREWLAQNQDRLQRSVWEARAKGLEREERALWSNPETAAVFVATEPEAAAALAASKTYLPADFEAAGLSAPPDPAIRRQWKEWVRSIVAMPEDARQAMASEPGTRLTSQWTRLPDGVAVPDNPRVERIDTPMGTLVRIRQRPGAVPARRQAEPPTAPEPPQAPPAAPAPEPTQEPSPPVAAQDEAVAQPEAAGWFDSEDVQSARTAAEQPPKRKRGRKPVEPKQRGKAEKPAAFTPTTEWQVVPDGMAIPPGLQIRMNLQEGRNEARLPPATEPPAPPVKQRGKADPPAEAEGQQEQPDKQPEPPAAEPQQAAEPDGVTEPASEPPAQPAAVPQPQTDRAARQQAALDRIAALPISGKQNGWEIVKDRVNDRVLRWVVRHPETKRPAWSGRRKVAAGQFANSTTPAAWQEKQVQRQAELEAERLISGDLPTPAANRLSEEEALRLIGEQEGEPVATPGTPEQPAPPLAEEQGQASVPGPASADADQGRVETTSSQVEKFVGGMAPMNKKRAQNALEQNVLNNGEIRKRREVVELAIAAGATVQTKQVVDEAARRKLEAELKTHRDYPIGNPNHPETKRVMEIRSQLKDGGPFRQERRLVWPDGRWLPDASISKTAIDYAEFLLAQKATAPPKQLGQKAEPAKEPWQMTRDEFTAEQPTSDVQWLIHDNPIIPNGTRLLLPKRGGFPAAEKGKSNAGTVATVTEVSNRVHHEGVVLTVETPDGESYPLVGDQAHRGVVELALREGKPVPAAVLADYPDLKPDKTPSTSAEQSAVRVPKEKLKSLKDLKTIGAVYVPGTEEVGGRYEVPSGKPVGKLLPGGEEVDSATPDIGKRLLVQDSEDQQLHEALVIAREENFDQMPTWTILWTEGPSKGETKTTYSHSFWKLADKTPSTSAEVPAEVSAPEATRMPAGKFAVPSNTDRAVEIATQLDPQQSGVLLGAYQRAHGAGYVGAEAQGAASQMYYAMHDGPVPDSLNTLGKFKTATVELEQAMRPAPEAAVSPGSEPAATGESETRPIDWSLVESGSLKGIEERDRLGLPAEAKAAVKVLLRGPATPSSVLEEMHRENQRTQSAAYADWGRADFAMKALDRLVELGEVEKRGVNDWDYRKQRFNKEAIYTIRNQFGRKSAAAETSATAEPEATAEPAKPAAPPPPRAEAPAAAPGTFKPPAIEGRAPTISDAERQEIEAQREQLRKRMVEIGNDKNRLERELNGTRRNANVKRGKLQGEINAKDSAIQRAQDESDDLYQKMKLPAVEAQMDAATTEEDWLALARQRNNLQDQIQRRKPGFGKKDLVAEGDRLYEQLKAVVTRQAEFVRPELNKDEFEGVVETATRDYQPGGRSLTEYIRMVADRQIKARERRINELTAREQPRWGQPTGKEPYRKYEFLSDEQRAQGVADMTEALKHPDWYDRAGEIEKRLQEQSVTRERVYREEQRAKQEKEAAEAAEKAAKADAERQAQQRRRQDILKRYDRFWQALKEEGKAIKGKTGTVIVTEQGKQTGKDENGKPIYAEKKVTKPAELLDDTWAIAENWKKSDPDEAKDRDRYSLIHRPSGLSASSANNPAALREIVALARQEGIDASDAHANKETARKVGRIVHAYERKSLDELGEGREAELLTKYGPKPTQTKADFIVDATHIGDESGRLYELAKEVPEFAYDPVMTVDKDGSLVYRDGYKYKFPSGSFGTAEFEAKPGQTIGFNLEDLGIPRKTAADVVADKLEEAGFKTTKGKNGITAKRGGSVVTVTGEGEKWTAALKQKSMGKDPVALAQNAIDNIRWRQPPIDAPATPQKPTHGGPSGIDWDKVIREREARDDATKERFEELAEWGVTSTEGVLKAKFLRALGNYRYGDIIEPREKPVPGERIRFTRNGKEVEGKVVRVHPRNYDGFTLVDVDVGQKNSVAIDADDIIPPPVKKAWHKTEYDRNRGYTVTHEATVEQVSKDTKIPVADLNAYAETGAIPASAEPKSMGRNKKAPSAAEAVKAEDERQKSSAGRTSSKPPPNLSERARAARQDFMDSLAADTAYIRGRPYSVATDPEFAIRAAKTVGKAVKAGVLTFADFVDQFGKAIGESVMAKLRPIYAAEWNKLAATDPRMDKAPEEPPKKQRGKKPVQKPAAEPKAEPPKAAEPPSPPAEPAAKSPSGPPEVTSIKNAAIEALREQRGEEQIESVSRGGFEDWLDAAKQVMGIRGGDTAAAMEASGKGINHAQALVALFDSGKQLPNEVDIAELQIYQRFLENIIYAKNKAANEATDAGDVSAAVIANKEREMYDGLRDQLEKVSRKIGTTQSLAFMARKIALEHDFSPSRLAHEWRAANGNRTLPSHVMVEIDKLRDEVADLKAKLAKAETQAEKAERDADIDDVLKGEPKTRGKKPAADVLKAKQEKFAKSAENLKSKLAAFGRFGQFAAERKTGNEAAELAEAFLEFAKDAVDLGITKFGQFVASFVKNVGKVDDATRADLKIAWDKVQPAAADTETDIDETEDLDRENKKAVHRLALKLTREAVESGVNGRKAVVAVVHEEMVDRLGEDWTEEDTKDAISGYGIFRELTKDDVSVEVRKIKGQLLQLAKLRDMKAGKAPEATGWESPEKDEDERALIKLVNEAKKRGGFVVTNSARLLKSALASAKTQIINRMKDMRRDMAEGEPLIRKRTPLKPDAELQKLRDEYAELKKLYDAAFPPVRKGTTDAQRLAAAERAVAKAIESLKGKLESGDLVPGDKAAPLSSPELVAMRAELKALQARQDELRKHDPAYQAHIEEKQDAAYEAHLLRREAELLRKIAEKDYAPPKRRTPRQTAATIELGFRIDKLTKQWQRDRAADWAKQRTVWQKVANTIPALGAFTKAIAASMEMSGMARQGKPMGTAHPLLMAQATRAMLEAAASEKNTYKWMRELESRPNARFADQSGLRMMDPDGPISQRQEEFHSNLADKIPIAGRAVRASERAYTTLLNVLRASVFDQLCEKFTNAKGEISLADGKYLANAVNVFTGAGSFGRYENMVEGLNLAMFSARYTWSRFQMLTLHPLWRKAGSGEVSSYARKLVAKEYGKILGGMMVYNSLIAFGMTGLGLLAASGAGGDDDKVHIEIDPRSSDFLKLRIGRTRIDLASGLSQTAVLVSRIWTQSTKKLNQEVKSLSDTGFREENVTDVLLKFGRSKLSPMFGMSLDFLSGANFVGEPANKAPGWAQDFFPKTSDYIEQRRYIPAFMLINAVTPLTYRDIYDTLKEHNIATSTAIALLAFMGEGVSTYNSPTSGSREADRLILNWNANNPEQGTLPSVPSAFYRVDGELLRLPSSKADELRKTTYAIATQILDTERAAVRLDPDHPTKPAVDYINAVVDKAAEVVRDAMVARQHSGTPDAPLDAAALAKTAHQKAVNSFLTFNAPRREPGEEKEKYRKRIEPQLKQFSERKFEYKARKHGRATP